MRFGIAFIAPFGRSRSRRYMFIGLVNMWRSIVVGRITRKPRNAMTWMPHDQRWRSWRVATLQPSTIPDSPHPTNDHFSKFASGPTDSRSATMRKASVVKPVTAITRNVVRITRCSGLVLIRIRYGRCP